MKNQDSHNADFPFVHQVLWAFITKLQPISKWEVIFTDIMPDDEGMIVEGNTIYLNRIIITSGGTDFGLLFAIHEVYHAIRQNFPSKTEGAARKSIGSRNLVVMMDIQADVVTADFLREAYNWDMDRYLDAYYNGVRIFNDNNVAVKPHKLVRFISSLVSVFTCFASQQRTCSLIEYSSTLLDGQPSHWLRTDFGGECLRFGYIESSTSYGDWREFYENGYELEIDNYKSEALKLITSLLDR